MYFLVITYQFKHLLLFKQVRLSYIFKVTIFYEIITICINFIWYVYACYIPKLSIATK